MNHLDVDVSCPCCGGSLDPINRARPTRMEATMVARCQPCRREFTLSLRMFVEPGRVASCRELTRSGALTERTN